MSEHTPENQEPLAEASQNDKVDQSRRKLTGAALGVSAVFTLASRPVLAGQCTTPSNAASGNLSQPGSVIPCTGKTPAEWATIPPGHYPGGNVNFHISNQNSGVFNSGSRAEWFTVNGGNTNFNTLKEVMEATDNTNTTNKPNPISKEFAAALLNIRGGFVPATVLTEMQLIGMWNDWLPDGIFVPKLSATWDTDHIITYLRTLQA
jgi:hypothetical protein